MTPPSLPTPLLRPKPPLLPWLIPLAALILVGILIAQALASRGPRLSLTFDDGYGIKANDPVMHRGVQIGRVRTATVDLANHKAVITLDLDRSASALATSGRFWIVRPELSLSRVSGLETIVGPRYIAADIDPAHTSTHAASLEAPPPDTTLDGLHLTIRALRAGSLAPGSPVSYREMRVGEVTGVDLASDARSVEISIRIDTQHAHLVRPTTRFWNVSGIGLDLGIVGGLKLKAESLRTILSGGLAFATPDKPAPSAPVPSGHEFVLSEYEDDSLKWSPDLSKP